MGKPAAKQGDQVTGSCTHTVVMGTASAPKGGFVFAGLIDGGLSGDVRIGGQPAAVVGSTATNSAATAHSLTAGGALTPTPDEKASLEQGSGTVRINGKAAARAGDKASICDELMTKGTVVAAGTVSIGD